LFGARPIIIGAWSIAFETSRNLGISSYFSRICFYATRNRTHRFQLFGNTQTRGFIDSPSEAFRFAAIQNKGDLVSRLHSLMSTLSVTRATGLNRRPFVLYAALIVAMTAVSTGYAVSASATDSSDSLATNADEGLSEIVVTAEKRDSTVQRTPISITALGSAQLEMRGITSIEDVVHQVPGVSLRTAGPGQSELEIRGLASSGGAAPTVGFYLDDTPLSPPALAINGKVVIDPNLYDVDRVEVLRGPQGTLYGSGSMGGTIRIITNQPQFDRFSGSMEADGSGTVGGGPNGTINAHLNVPLIDDKLALRVVATEKYDSGFVDRIVENPFPLPTNNGCAPIAGFYGCARGNVLNGNVVKEYKDVNWEHLYGARMELLAKPTDHLKILTTLMFQNLDEGGPPNFDGPPGDSPILAHYQPADIREPFQDHFYMVANTITYEMNFATLTAATSYWGRKSQQTEDSAEQFQSIYFLEPASTNPDQSFVETDTSHQFAQEIRLASSSTGPFSWIVGGFFSSLIAPYREYGASPFCAISVGGCAANPTGITVDASAPYKVKQYAVFSDVSYHVTQTLTATAGLRYSYFENSLFQSVSGLYGPSGNATPSTNFTASNNHAATPKFNLAYEPNADLTLYATASEGFRPGGISQAIPTQGPNSCLAALNAIGLKSQPLSYNPDSIWNYELGEKARLLDQNLTINADIYYIRWKGIQQVVTLPCGNYYDDNVGNAESYGPELEISYNLSANLTLEGSYVHTHATLTHADPGTGFEAGQRILNTPDYTESTALVYHQSIGNDAKLTARIGNQLVGTVRDISFTYVTLPSYDVVNTRVQIDKGFWSAALYANNLTDKHAELSSNTTAVAINVPSLIRFSTNQPLTIGIDLRHKF
jgi:iron complex outermembrane recepter protein